MRTFGSGFQTKLESGSFAPILLVHYELKEYISGDEPNTGSTVVTDYYWSERGTTFGGNEYQPTIINSSPLNMELDASRQVFSEFSLQVGNNLGQLVSVIQSGMKATVYLGFQESDGSVTDAEVMFIGTVEGDIEITEDSVSFNLQDIAYSYDRQLPNLIDEANFVGAGREDIGMPLPIICGRAKDHKCRSINGQFTTTIAENVTQDYDVDVVSDFNIYSQRGFFVQSQDSLRNKSAGGYWWTDWTYDQRHGDLNITVSDELIATGAFAGVGQGITVRPLENPPTAAYSTQRTVYLNDLSVDLDIEEGEYYFIYISSWQDGWTSGSVRVVGWFEDGNGTELDGGVSTSIPGVYTFKGSSPAYPTHSDHTWVLKATSSREWNKFGLTFSHDFDGTIVVNAIGKMNKSQDKNFIYVADDIGFWKKNYLVADDDNNLSIDLDVSLDYVVPDVSDTSWTRGEAVGSVISSRYTVDSIEFDADGFYVSMAGQVFSSYEGDVTVDGNKLFFTGIDVTEYFEVGNYLYTEGDEVGDWLATDVGVEGEGEIDNIADYVSITRVVEGDEYGTNYIEVSATLDSNKYATIDDVLNLEISGSTVTLVGGYWSTYGVQSGTSISINGTDYDIYDVFNDELTIGGYFPIPESGYYSVYYAMTLYDIDEIVPLVIRNHPKNLWKITFNEPIFYPYKTGMTVTAVSDDDEVFCVADHPVQRISNVKVNGISLPDDIGFVPELSSTSHSADGKDRAYIRIPFEKLANVAALALNIDTSVAGSSNTTNVADEITVSDEGHTHEVGAARTYNWSLELYHSSFNYITSLASPKIVVRSGNFSTTMSASGYINPLSFTSDNPKCYVEFFDGYNISRTIQFARTDSLTGTTQYDYQAKSGTDGSMASRIPIPEDGNSTTLDSANVLKIGTASRGGDYVDEGYLIFNSPVFLAQSRSKLEITCDVMGNIDGEDGYQPPHHQIRSLINTYATNPINGTEGNADIVEFVNESAMDTYFNKVWNTYSSEEVATDIYPALQLLINTNTESATNLSPNADLGNSLIPVAVSDTDTASAIHYNEKGVHCLDFSINQVNQFRDVLGDMLLQANMVCVWRNGIAYLKLLTETPVNDGTLDSSDMVMKTMSLSRSPVADLATDITVNFDNGLGGYNRVYHYAKHDWSSGQLEIVKLDATRKYGSYDRDKHFDLTMVREQVAAEILAKRFYDEYSDTKFHSRFTTVLSNLAFEPTDNLTVSIPIHRDSMMDRGLVTRKTINFGSAVEKRPDLIDFEIRENHTTSGYYLSLYL